MVDKNEMLKLSNNVSFPLYACARATSKYYRRFMDEMGLTYTQYLTMLALWEEKETNLKTLGERLYLDSGTLTPVLKRLEEMGYIRRDRQKDDERNLVLSVTPEGEALKDKVYEVSKKMAEKQPLSREKNKQLYALFNEALENYERMFAELEKEK